MKVIIRPLTEIVSEAEMTFAEVIFHGRWLRDDHMDAFGTMLKTANSNFDMQPVWKVQRPDLIQAVSSNTKHIQILHSCENMQTNEGGHWVCSYYDTKKIYIYDSLNRNKLHRHHQLYLKTLFPFYPIQRIEFRRVQQQPNSSDCGVFSIAFAILILYGQNPENVTYTVPAMRKHLLKMFESEVMETFPSSARLEFSKVSNHKSEHAKSQTNKDVESPETKRQQKERPRSDETNTRKKSSTNSSKNLHIIGKEKKTAFTSVLEASDLAQYKSRNIHLHPTADQNQTILTQNNFAERIPMVMSKKMPVKANESVHEQSSIDTQVIIANDTDKKTSIDQCLEARMPDDPLVVPNYGVQDVTNTPSMKNPYRPQQSKLIARNDNTVTSTRCENYAAVTASSREISVK